MKGALSGMFSACLGLIVLHAIGTSGGSGRVSAAFKDANTILEHILDPKVPAIPDLRAPSDTVAQGKDSANYDLLTSLKPSDFAPRTVASAAGSSTPAGKSTSSVGTTAARYNLGRVGGL